MKNNRKLTSIQGIRGIAIVMIFLSHTQVFLYDGCSLFDNWGSTGVYIFIAISGSLVAYNFDKYEYSGTLKEGVQLSLKKVKKLYWLHFLMWIVSAIMALNNLSVIRMVIYSLFNLTLTQSYIPFSGIINSFNGPSWYLSMSTFLWMMTPIMVAQYKKRCQNRRRYTLTSIILTIGIIIVWLFIANKIISLISEYAAFLDPSWVADWLTYSCPLLCFLYYMLSFLIARQWPVNSIWNKVVLTLSCAFFVVYIITKPTLPIILKPLINISVSIIVTSAIKGSSVVQRLLLENKLITYIGNISSYIFLIHGVVNVALRNYAMSIRMPWLFVLSAVITLMLSTGAKWIYEFYTKRIVGA